MALSQGEQITLNARGKLKFRGGELLTGDFVEVENGAIVKLYPRKNRLYRPNVCNVDLICALISCAPAPDLLLADKIILTASYYGLDCALIITKGDTEASKKLCEQVIREYGEAVKNIFCVSAKTGEGISELSVFLKNKSAVLAGQSAVGKTTLVNALFGTDFKTGELSDKLNRGRHTTTFSRIITGGGLAVFDTPGFSEYAADVPLEHVSANFPPYENYLGKCKFCDCTHTGEPDCAVALAAARGEISLARYERYKTVYSLIKTENNKYEK